MSDRYKIFTKPEFTVLKIITSDFQGRRVLSPIPFDITHAKSLVQWEQKAPQRNKRTDYHKPIVLAQRRQNNKPNELISLRAQCQGSKNILFSAVLNKGNSCLNIWVFLKKHYYTMANSRANTFTHRRKKNWPEAKGTLTVMLAN